MADVKRASRSNERGQMLTSNQPSGSDDSESYNPLSQESDVENLAWRDLTEEQVIALLALTPLELETKLAEICSCHKYQICLKEACILDYYVSAFWFSKRIRFTTEQISVFFSLVKTLLESIRDRQMPLTENIEQMKNYMKSIGCKDSEKQTDLVLFNVEQAKIITDYLTESLFQHYKLYELVFSTAMEERHVINKRLTVQVPPKAELPFPPPLDEAVTEEVYGEFVLGPVESFQKSGETLNEGNRNGEQQLKVESPISFQGKMSSVHEDIVSDNSEQIRRTLLNNLEDKDIKQVLNDVSGKILNEVKNGIQNKLKEREALILSKIAKR